MRLILFWVLGIPAVALVWLVTTGWIIPSYANGRALAHIRASGSAVIDLTKAVPSDWDRVCVLGPYSTDTIAATTLGFDWKVDMHSSIGSSDSISLIVFEKHGKVVRDIDVPRRDGDFSNLSGRCFPRDHAKFVLKPLAPGAWPYVVPEDAA